MSMILDFEKLYEPYSKDADLKTTMLWFEREAAKLGVPSDVRDAAVAETFLEMANGKTFSTDGCTCGCEFPIKWSSVDMNHYALKKMIEKNKAVQKARSDALLDSVNKAVLNHIQAQNEAYEAEAMPPIQPSRWTDWGRSPVVRSIKRLAGKP